jgi:hypothetical protein
MSATDGQETAGSKMLAELMVTGAIGMWKDRQDIEDSSTLARHLRARAEKRADRSPSFD